MRQAAHQTDGVQVSEYYRKEVSKMLDTEAQATLDKARQKLADVYVYNDHGEAEINPNVRIDEIAEAACAAYEAISKAIDE